MLARLVSLLFLVLLSLLIVNNLGNPLAGLGSTGSLQGKALKALEELASPLSGRSLLYGEPTWRLALTYALNTLEAVLPSFALAFVLAYLSAALDFFPPALRFLAFVPEYLYAALLWLSSWYLLWPPPLPGSGPSKLLCYSLVVVLAEYPRLLLSIKETLDSAEWLRDVSVFWKAVGLSELGVRLKLLRSVAPEVSSTALTFLALSLERSAFVEPMLSFTGVGYLLFKAVTNDDPPLALASFLTVSFISFTFISSASMARKLLGVRR